jgi:hypothetical protein
MAEKRFNALLPALTRLRELDAQQQKVEESQHQQRGKMSSGRKRFKKFKICC